MKYFRVLNLNTGNNITFKDVYSAINSYTYYSSQFDWENIASYEWTFGVCILNLLLKFSTILHISYLQNAGLYIFTNIPRPSRDIFPSHLPRPEFESKPGAREEDKNTAMKPSSTEV